MTGEKSIHIESVRTSHIRGDSDVTGLVRSIRRDGLRHPITIWADGTLVSGERRLRAHFQLANTPGFDDYRQIQAVVVDTVEAAAKRLLNDNSDDAEAVPLKPSQVCKLWAVLRQLDAPAAARRLTEARRKGVELRRQTQAGKRKPGRTGGTGRGDEYFLTVASEPFGMSEATASRLWAIYKLSVSDAVEDARRAQATAGLATLDAGESSIYAVYAAVLAGRNVPVSGVRTAPAAEPVPAARQRAAWDRILPQLEGLVAGLTELGPPNPDLDWSHVGPVYARLKKIRRDLEKTINNMRETAQS